MQFPELSRAASPEGIIALAVVYFIFAIFSKLKKAAEKTNRPQLPQDRPGVAPAPGESAPAAFSLEAVLQEIQRVKQEAERRQLPPPDQGRPRHSVQAIQPKPKGDRPRQLQSSERRGRMAAGQDERGPLGRHSKTSLPVSEDFEDRSSLEDGGSIERAGRLENLDDSRRRRVDVDQDDGTEALSQRRLQQAESRNRAFSETDHREFHDKIKQAESATAAKRAGLTPAQLRQAFIWREILGPPKSLE